MDSAWAMHGQLADITWTADGQRVDNTWAVHEQIILYRRISALRPYNRNSIRPERHPDTPGQYRWPRSHIPGQWPTVSGIISSAIPCMHSTFFPINPAAGMHECIAHSCQKHHALHLLRYL